MPVPFSYHHDGLGSTAALTSASGQVVEQYSYDVFGQPTIKDAAGTVLGGSAYANRFLFTGREWLASAGVYDYRHRAYSPALGRFLQNDPIRFEGGNVNMYDYVSANPVNYLDSFGLYITYGTGSAAFWNDYRNAYNRLNSTPTGANLLRAMENCNSEYHVQQALPGDVAEGVGNTMFLRDASDAVTLAHEAEHVITNVTGNPDLVRRVSDPADTRQWGGTDAGVHQQSNTAESQATRMQNIVAREMMQMTAPRAAATWPGTHTSASGIYTFEIVHPFGR